jgi:hypothetical protein
VQEPFDWNRLAKYAFRLALVCLFIAVFSLLVDTKFLELISRVLEISAYVRSALTAAIAYSIHRYAYKRSQSYPLELWTNEAIHAVGAIIMGLAALQLAEAIGGLVYERDVFNIKARIVLLLLGSVYLGTGFATGSIFIWSCGLFALGVWTLYWTPTRYVDAVKKLRLESEVWASRATTRKRLKLTVRQAMVIPLRKLVAPPLRHSRRHTCWSCMLSANASPNHAILVFNTHLGPPLSPVFRAAMGKRDPSHRRILAECTDLASTRMGTWADRGCGSNALARLEV